MCLHLGVDLSLLFFDLHLLGLFDRLLDFCLLSFLSLAFFVFGSGGLFLLFLFTLAFFFLGLETCFLLLTSLPLCFLLA